jgi:transposase-like protein
MTRWSQLTIKKKQDAILVSLAAGASVNKACKAAGVVRQTLWNWVNKYPDFAATVRDSKHAAIKVVYDAMFRAATGHKYAECKVTLDNVYEDGFPKTGPHGKPLVKRTRVRITKEVQPNVAAADLWLRNHDRGNYIQRQPEVAVGVDLEALRKSLSEEASAYPKPEPKEKEG